MNLGTIFIDIDGTILKHHGTLQEIELLPPEILPGVKEKLLEWQEKGYNIIVVTARPERLRILTRQHLAEFNITYTQLIMNVKNGPRYLINDTKPYANMEETAFAVTVKRDKGLSDCNL